jgi:thiamine biosynthesis protein ThiI
MKPMDFTSPMRHVLVHYNEIALKGKNRGYFERSLIDALRYALRGQGWKKVKRLYGRLLVEFRGEIPWQEVERRVSRVFGVSHFERARRTPLDLEAIRVALGESLAAIPADSVKSFAIIARRPNKAFPLNSIEVNRELGRFVKERTGWAVSLEDPQLPIHVYLLHGEAFFAFGRSPGPGGLPTGTAGKVACLISGGIDSPVASHRLMRRGCEPIFVHFHSFPHTSAASIEKARQTAAILLCERGSARLYLVPFAELQRRIVAQCPPQYRILLYRRFMLRTAEAIARREGAVALVTGESLGQVASQTLWNLAGIEAAVSIPVLRPLVGFDKMEIVKEAVQIGTFDLSIEPHDDCCGFLMPRNPATCARPEDLEAAEAPFRPQEEVEALLAATEVVEVGEEEVGGRKSAVGSEDGGGA